MSATPGVEAPRRGEVGPVLFSYGFRPFFLGSAVWAVISLAVWLVAFEGATRIPSAFDPFAWHAHEMIFGFVGAAIAGFLLTAVSAWTGRPPIRGMQLAFLFVLWMLGRLLVAYSEQAGVWPAAVIDVAFPLALMAVVGHEIVAARNVRNYGVIAMLGVFAFANFLMHLSALGLSTRIVGERLGIGVIVVLIGLIGGRVAPAFTRNWLVRQGKAMEFQALPALDKIAHALTALAMLSWASTTLPMATAILALAAAVAQIIRMSRWQGAKTLSEPIVAVLHIGYAWVPFGLLLLGLRPWVPVIDENAAIHALTAGAMGTMILAIMTRATLGHTGRQIASSDGTTAIYVLVVLSGALRVLGPHVTAFYYHLLVTSGVLWVLAFGLFLALYGHYMFKPRIDKIGT